MEQIKLKATVREKTGKQHNRKVRREGLVPGVVYHRGEKSVPILVDNKEISRIFREAASENVLISLSIENEKKKSRAVIVKEIQHDPVKRSIVHVDFNEISLTERITVEVEVVAQGEAVGVKQDGGILDHPLRSVKVECLPTDIPKHIDVDVSALKLNDSIHVKDLGVSDKVKVLSDPDAVLFQVKLPVEEKVEEAAPAETQEPEVIREKKEEEAKPGEKKEEAKAKDEPPAKGGSAPGGKAEKK